MTERVETATGKLVDVVKAMELDRQMELLSHCCGRLCVDCVLRDEIEVDQQRRS
jgi:hypothetical protein